MFLSTTSHRNTTNVAITIRSILFLLLLMQFPVIAQEEEVRDFYEETGVNKFQEQVSDAPNESVDPFSGLLQVSHNDITIPGNNGLDVVVRRAYTSRSRGGVPADTIGGVGSGWVMHFGRIVFPAGTQICGISPTPTTLVNTLDNASVELTSGGRELLVESSIPGVSGLITRSNLRGRCLSVGPRYQYEIRSPDGKTYLLDLINEQWRVVRITDIHNNWIRIDYTVFGAPTNIYRSFEYTDDNNPLLKFNYHANGLLDKIEFGDQTWTYNVEPKQFNGGTFINVDFQLSEVIRPDGKSWKYEYNDNDFSLHPLTPGSTPGAGSLKKMTYPDGGSIEYTYQDVLFNPDDDDPVDGEKSHAVHKKIINDNLTDNSGEWTFEFNPRSDGSYPGADKNEGYDVSPPLALDVTTVTSPFGKTVYSYFGASKSSFSPIIAGNPVEVEITFPTSLVGTLARKSVYSSDNVLLEARENWWSPRKISDEWFLQGDKFPIQVLGSDSQRVTNAQDISLEFVKENPTWGTEGAHAATVYDDHDEFGNPKKVTYTANVRGLSDLVVEYTYLNDLDKWILGLPLTETFKDGNTVVGTVTRVYDPITRDITSETRFGVTSTYDYHSDGELKEVTDTNGVKTLYEDYKAGIPQKETSGISTSTNYPEVRAVTRRTVNPTGTIADITNANNNKTSFRYDNFNRLTRITYPINTAASVTYSNATPDNVVVDGGGSPCAQCARRTLRRGDYVQTDYLDGFGRIIATSRGDGSNGITDIVTKTDYDSRGLTATQFFANSNEGVGYEYDNLQRLVKQTNSDGSVQTMSYDENEMEQIDENGNVTKILYKNRGADFGARTIALVTEPEQIVTQFSRDVLGNLVEILQGKISADGTRIDNVSRRTYDYDDNYFLEFESNRSGDIPSVSYTYDNVGNLKTRTPVGTNIVTTYSYDSLYRVRDVSFNDGTESIVSDYDLIGNVKSTVNGLIERGYEYNKNENLVEELLRVTGDHDVLYTTTHNYNNNDNLTSNTYPSGLVIDYRPDVLGRPTKVGDFASNVLFHPTGQLDSLRLGNNKTVKYELDQRRFPKSITASGAVGISYSYDSVGNIKSITDSLDDARSISMPADAYDGLNRLRKVNGPWGLAEYDYLEHSPADINSRTINGNTEQYSYVSPNAISRLTSITSSTVQKNRFYDYDQLGNMASRRSSGSASASQADTFIYDANSYLESAEIDGELETYLYDAGGMKSATLGDKPNQRQYEFYSGGQLLFEDARKECTQTDYVYLGSILIAKSADKLFEDTADADNDGLPDCYEYSIGLNPNNSSDGGVDTDGDGISDRDELTMYFTDPFDTDSDGDGISDSDEVAAGTIPSIDENGFEDVDSDGFSNRQEERLSKLGVNGSGHLLWKWGFDTNITTPIVLDAEGVLYFGDDKGTLFAVLPTGRVKWRYDSGDHAITTSPVVDVTDGTIFFGDESGAVFAVTDIGQLKWQYQTASNVLSSPALNAVGELVVASGNELIVFEKEHDVALNQGIVKWQTSLNGSIGARARPAIGIDDTVYIGDNTSTLYAISGSDGVVSWQSSLPFSLENSAPQLTHKEITLLDATGRIHQIAQESGVILGTIQNTDSDMRSHLAVSEGFGAAKSRIVVNQRILGSVRSYIPGVSAGTDFGLGAEAGYLAMDNGGTIYGQNVEGQISRITGSGSFITESINQEGINFTFAKDNVIYQVTASGFIYAYSNKFSQPSPGPLWGMNGAEFSGANSIVKSNSPALELYDLPTTPLFETQEYSVTAFANDRVDGDSTENVEWTQSGAVRGTGQRFVLDTRVAGNKRVSVSVLDRDGNVTSRSFDYRVLVNQPPEVTIADFGRPTILQEELPVMFSATAFDDFDGDISESIVWSSSADGQLGVGGTISVANLSEAEHVITARATDQSGKEDSDFFNLVVVIGAANDPDDDGLTNEDEIALGTNPLRPDTDGDGVNDGIEVAIGLNPLWRDTDHDGLADGAEIALDTNPFVDYGEALSDADGDGFSNRQEEAVGANMLDLGSVPTVGSLMWSVPNGGALALNSEGLIYNATGSIFYRDGYIKAQSDRRVENVPVLGKSGQAYYGGGCDGGIYTLSEEGMLEQFAYTSGLTNSFCQDIDGFPMDFDSSRWTSPAVNESETLFVSPLQQDGGTGPSLYVGYNQLGEQIALYPNDTFGFFPDRQIITHDDQVILNPFDAYNTGSYSVIGETNWVTGSGQASISIADQNGNVFNSTAGAFDADGTQLWSQWSNGSRESQLLMNEGDAIYWLEGASFGRSSTVQKHSPIDGAAIILQDCEATGLLFIGRNDKLYVSGGGGIRVCDPNSAVVSDFSLESIERPFLLDVQDGITPGFVVDKDGTMYVSSNIFVTQSGVAAGTLNAYVTKSGGLNKGLWPKARRDNRNSAAQDQTPIGPDAARILQPYSGSRLATAEALLVWEDSDADEYQVLVGTTEGSGDLYEETVPGGATSLQLTNLPQNEQPIYVTLITKVGDLEAFDQAVYPNDVDYAFDFPPVIFKPNDRRAEAAAILTEVEVGEATALDREDGTLTATADQIPAAFPLGETEINWSATDTSGNTSSAVQLVTIEDTTRPVLTAPDDVTIRDVILPPGVFTIVIDAGIGEATATDIFPVEITNNAPAEYGVGTTTVTWTATDTSGNQTSADQRVTVRLFDESEPVVTPPADVVAEATAVLTPVDLGTATAVDKEDGDLPVSLRTPGPYPLGETIVFWSARDSDRNTVFAEQLVTVVDTTAPTLVVPASIVVDSITPIAVDFGDATASDIFEVTVTNDAPAIFPLGVTTVSWQAVDASGNVAQAEQTVTVRAPVSGGDTAEIQSPANGVTFDSRRVLFTWNDVGAERYRLRFGSSIGANDIRQASTTAGLTEKLIIRLPYDGSTVYLRFATLKNGVWTHVDYEYTALNDPSPQAAEISTPTPSTTLNSSRVKFTWNDVGAERYRLWFGSTLGGNDWFKGGVTGDKTERTISGLPLDGSTVYLRFSTFKNDEWNHVDYEYTAFDDSSPQAAEISTPTPNSTLDSSRVTFSWNDVGAERYRLWVGSAPGGNDWFRGTVTGDKTERIISGLPLDGSTVYVRFSTFKNNAWSHVNSVYTALTSAGPQATTLVSPLQGTTFTSPHVNFQWQDTGADRYRLSFGSDVGLSDIKRQTLNGGVTERLVRSLLHDGSTIHLRLSGEKDGIWAHTDYTFTAHTDPVAHQAELSSHANNQTLIGADIVFEWNDVQAQRYSVLVGSAPGQSDLLDIRGLDSATTSVTASGLPVDGSTVFVRLWTRKYDVWTFIDYEFTSAIN